MSPSNGKQKILIIDDSEINREILKEILKEKYDTLEAENGYDAVELMQRNIGEISLVLLDIVMPTMNGFDVLAVMNSKGWIEDVPVIMISSETDPSYIEKAYDLGAADFINRPFDVNIVKRRCDNTIMLYAKQRNLAKLAATQIIEKEKTSSIMISILSHIVEFRNGESGLHVLHVQMFTEILLKRLILITDKYQIYLPDIALIKNASALHDIGKISISDSILNKPGKLTKEEFEIMKTHSAIGAQMIDNLPISKSEPLVKTSYEICRWHHERYDGGGYPDGLKGDEIPISAQVTSLADVYDALTSKRCYKEAYSHDKALDMIKSGECGSFNPILLKCLDDCSDTIKSEMSDCDSANNIAIRDESGELKMVAAEFAKHNISTLTERSLLLLRHERLKNDFFSSLSRDILFEYTSSPPILTFLSLGDYSGYFKRDHIPNPLHDKILSGIVKKSDMDAIVNLIKSADLSNPIVRYKFTITRDSQKADVALTCRAVFSEDSSFSGVIGKIVHA
jgi:response regulator RpfG family c-di-GMP phosphodiesterase